jgi:hypothetical protein
MATRAELLSAYITERSKGRSKLTRDKNNGLKTTAHLYDDLNKAVNIDIKTATRKQISDATKTISRERKIVYSPGEEGTPIKKSTIKEINKMIAKQADFQAREVAKLKNEKYNPVGWKGDAGYIWEVFEYNPDGSRPGHTVKRNIANETLRSEANAQKIKARIQKAIDNYDKNNKKTALTLRENMARVLSFAGREATAKRVSRMSAKEIDRLAKTTDFIEQIFAKHQTLEAIEDEYNSDFYSFMRENKMGM